VNRAAHDSLEHGPSAANWREQLHAGRNLDLDLRRHTDPEDCTVPIGMELCIMFKAIFGLLGLLIALAIVSSLAKTQLGAIGQIGQKATRVLSLSGGDGKTADDSVGRAVGGARLDGFAATAGAEAPSAQKQVQGVQQSVIGRTNDAWRQSEERYKRADP